MRYKKRVYLSYFLLGPQFQSQKTQGFCVADFATLSGGRRPRSKNFPLFIWIKEPCVRKFEGLERSKLLGISQTKFACISSAHKNRSKYTDLLCNLPYLHMIKIFKGRAGVVHGEGEAVKDA